MSKALEGISKKLQKQKIVISTHIITQGSILSDFRKTKHKCIVLSQQLDNEFPNLHIYEAVQKEVNQKYELLDLHGLGELKNKLTKSSNQLLDLQVQLKTQKQRMIARNQFNKLLHTTSSTRLKDGKNISMQQIKRRASKLQEQEQNPNLKTQQLKANVMNAPIYLIKDDKPVNKVEKIAQFVASMKRTQSEQIRSMKQQVEDKAAHNIKDILHQDPQYLRTRQQLQRYKMREEELEAKIKAIEQKAVERFVKTAQVIEEKEDYITIKVYKNSSLNFRKQNIPLALRQQNEKEDAVPRKMNITKLQQQIQAIKTKRKDPQIQQIQKQLEKDKYNLKQIVLKINSTLEHNEEKLRKLREQRMKIFEKQQQIWAELEMI